MKTDGLYMKYFILKPKGEDAFAFASREAMKLYAKLVKSEAPGLSDQLTKWVESLETPIQKEESK
jgi:hypothetical protein